MGVIVKIIAAKAGLATIVGGGLAAIVLGLASPAQADLGHNIWAHQQNRTSASAPQVDTRANH
jgi:hypothetical protein